MNLRTFALGALTLFASSATLEAQLQFVAVPGGASAMDITPDGKTVVGHHNSGGGYYWNWRTDPAPTLIGGYNTVAVSDDGSVIAGSIWDANFGAEVAARWTQATGWVSIGFLPNAMNCPSRSNAYDISGDGTAIVGLSWSGCKGRAFRWTAATGMVQLQMLANDNNRASVISPGGEFVGGFAQGNFERTPALWFPDNTGTVFDANDIGEVFGFSDDATMILGLYNGDAFYLQQGQAMQKIGTLNAGWFGNALDVTNDKKTIVGFDNLMLAREAWVWTQPSGIVSLHDHLVNGNVPNVWDEIEVCKAITPDGGLVIGHSMFQGAFIATMPISTAQKYGCGLNPPASMTVSGTPHIGSVVTLGLDNPLGTQSPGSSTLLMFSVAPDPSFPCGIAVPGLGMTPGSPGELLISLGSGQLFLVVGGPTWTGPGNPVQFPLPIPNDPILVGFTVYAQGAILGLPNDYPLNALTDAAKLQIGY